MPVFRKSNIVLRVKKQKEPHFPSLPPGEVWACNASGLVNVEERKPPHSVFFLIAGCL